MIIPVILSGGSGTRLWPRSRELYPKQLLPLVSERSLLQETVLRLDALAGETAAPMIISNRAHGLLIKRQLEAIDRPAGRLVYEPVGRNTAPAAAVAAILAEQAYPESRPILLLLPADHVIADPQAFSAAVSSSRDAAREGALVTFGVIPDSAETGYGYIKRGGALGELYAVERFVEKPDADRAREYVESGAYYWNSGMFLFSASSYLTELTAFAPDIVSACRRATDEGADRAGGLELGRTAFESCPKDSIDYAVMEHTEAAAVVPLDAGWSDVGSWAALHGVSEQDKDGNTISGDVVTHDCRDSYISGSSRLVAAVGLEEIVVVEDKDSVLVAKKDKTQNVKELVDELKQQNREETKLHRQVFRPWGSYDSIDADEGFQVKRLIVNPGAVLSLQKHAKRAEHWTVVRGKARITLDDKEFDLTVNESTYIPIGAVHRIANPFDEPVHIIEVQCGDYLGEDDIVRLEDNYGREGTNT